MSGALTGGVAMLSLAKQGLAASGLVGQLPPAIQGLLGMNARSLGAIIPDVTIDERHSDRMTVTQHPVADNSPVSDHAYRMPATVTMRIGFSNSNLVGSIVQGAMSGAASGGIGGALSGGLGIGSGGLTGGGAIGALTEQRVKTVYNGLLALQMSRQPFTLTTGKRTYPATVPNVAAPSSGKIGSMLITELGITTDHTSEYALMVEVHMVEVIQVKTSTTSQPAVSDQSNPQKTAAPTDTGTKQPTPQPDDDTSVLGHIAGTTPVKSGT